MEASSNAPKPSIKPPVIEHYEQLFPKAGHDFPMTDTTGDEKTTSVSSDLSSFDPESDKIPYSAKIRDLSKLMMFAEDLSNLISILIAVRKIALKGSARSELCHLLIGPPSQSR